MLMLHHATVIIVRMRTAHGDAIHCLRFGDLRRQSEGDNCSDYACNADAMTDHVSKLRSSVTAKVGERPSLGEGTPGMGLAHRS